MENEKKKKKKNRLIIFMSKLIWKCLHVKLLLRQNSVFLFCLTYYKKQAHERDKNLH